MPFPHSAVKIKSFRLIFVEFRFRVCNQYGPGHGFPMGFPPHTNSHAAWAGLACMRRIRGCTQGKKSGWRNDLLLSPPSFLKQAKFYNGAGIYETGVRRCCITIPCLNERRESSSMIDQPGCQLTRPRHTRSPS